MTIFYYVFSLFTSEFDSGISIHAIKTGSSVSAVNMKNGNERTGLRSEQVNNFRCWEDC